MLSRQVLTKCPSEQAMGHKVLSYLKRLRLCRGSVLVSDTQVRGFKPGRRRRIFLRAIGCISQSPFGHHFSPIVPPLAARGLPRVVNAGGTWRPEQKRLEKQRGCTISHTGCSASRGQNAELDPNPNYYIRRIYGNSVTPDSE